MIRISDHALLRWIERQYGLDVEKYRSELQTLLLPHVTTRPKYAPVADLWAVFDNHPAYAVVVTLLPCKPTRAASKRHDDRETNQTHVRSEKAHWKAKTRKRAHK